MKVILKTVKIPAHAYDAMRAVREELLRRGLNALPLEIVDPPNCPACGGVLKHVSLGYEHFECARCDYRQQTLTATSDNGVALGIGFLVGLGAAALLNSLAGPSERGRRLRATKLRAFAQSPGNKKSCRVPARADRS